MNKKYMPKPVWWWVSNSAKIKESNRYEGLDGWSVDWGRTKRFRVRTWVRIITRISWSLFTSFPTPLNLFVQTQFVSAWNGPSMTFSNIIWSKCAFENGAVSEKSGGYLHIEGRNSVARNVRVMSEQSIRWCLLNKHVLEELVWPQEVATKNNNKKKHSRKTSITAQRLFAHRRTQHNGKTQIKLKYKNIRPDYHYMSSLSAEEDSLSSKLSSLSLSSSKLSLPPSLKL